MWLWEVAGSEVSLLLGLRAKVLLVLGAARRLPHLCVLRHVSQRVGADDVPAEEEGGKQDAPLLNGSAVE